MSASRRLSATELDALVYKLAASKNKSIDPDLSSQSFRAFTTNQAFLFVEQGKRKYILVGMCKDARSDSNNQNLNYIGDVLKKLFESYKNFDCTVLIPLFLCRGFLRGPIEYLGREHCVLVEIDLASLRVQIHDSQGLIPKLFYFDVNIGNKMLQYNPEDYHAYGIQWFSDHHSCGFHAFYWMQNIINTGHARGQTPVGSDPKIDSKFTLFHYYGIDISATLQENSTSAHREVKIEDEEFMDIKPR